LLWVWLAVAGLLLVAHRRIRLVVALRRPLLVVTGSGRRALLVHARLLVALVRRLRRLRATRVVCRGLHVLVCHGRGVGGGGGGG